MTNTRWQSPGSTRAWAAQRFVTARLGLRFVHRFCEFSETLFHIVPSVKVTLQVWSAVQVNILVLPVRRFGRIR
jgi:hypothetical protein